MSQRLSLAAASLAVRLASRFMPDDPILRRKASMRIVSATSTAVRICSWAMLPAFVLGMQCAFVSTASLGMTMWARVRYEFDNTIATVKSLPAVAAAKSRALAHSIHLSTVQRQPLRTGVTMDTISSESGGAVPVRRLTEANMIIAQCERKRLQEQRTQQAHKPQEDEWLGQCGA